MAWFFLKLPHQIITLSIGTVNVISARKTRLYSIPTCSASIYETIKQWRFVLFVNVTLKRFFLSGNVFLTVW